MATRSAEQGVPEHRLVFGRRVRMLRERSELSQEALAEAAGIHRTYVSGVEQGKRNVGLDNIVALAAALDVTAASLMRGV